MGCRFEIWAWEKDHYGEYGGYIYNIKWSGNSAIKMVFELYKAKKANKARTRSMPICLKLMWR